MATDRREILVQTALRLFSRDGFHATGIDAILAEAGVAKMTLYNHFKSKEELIVAALHRQDEHIRNWMMRTVERKGRTPRQRLLALFDFLNEWFHQKDFFGCNFINACAEYSAPDHPVHIAAAQHKALVLNYVKSLAAAAGAPDPGRLAEQINLLMEGAIVTAHVSGRTDSWASAREAADGLIGLALGGAPGTG